ncbi:hypothetical protein [Pedobacter frigiditerrae]|uniref:hypothetical protein n=1 Tax=Pedobacter frigiditerrae TaxID=2530452 RepID=UPI00292F572D|nr:hypothetical protein [Pedobacter frigiditerrae]
MKKFASPLFFSIALVGIMLIYSCKKDIKHFFDSDEQGIQWAKDYYETKLQLNQSYRLNLTASSDKSISSKNNALTNEKKPDWKKSKTGTTPYYDFVELPLNYTHKISHTFSVSADINAKPVPNQKIIDASFDRLVIYKDKKGNIDQRIISFIPDEAYLAKRKNNISHNRIDKLDNDFVGYLHYKDWSGKALFVLRIVNGKPVKRYDMLKSVTGKIPATNTAKPTKGKLMVVDGGGGGGGNPPGHCYVVSWDWYQDCYYSTPESENPYYCDPVVIYNVQYAEIACPPVDGGGGGGPSDPPLEPEPCLGVLVFATGECILEKDCAGVEGGSAYMASCGCIGGTTGIDSCTKDPCTQAKIMNFKISNTTISNLSAVLDGKTTNKEWGAEIRLMADGITTISTEPSSNGDNSYEPTFTYNGNDGYTVGFNHTHKITGNDIGYPAPSAGDILMPFSKAYTPGVTSTGKQQFYMDNMWVGIRSGNNKYIITVNNWAGLYNMYDGKTVAYFNGLYDSAILDYAAIHPLANNTELSEYAFLSVFGDKVNFLKLNNSTGKYEAYEMGVNETVTKKNCP